MFEFIQMHCHVYLYFLVSLLFYTRRQARNNGPSHSFIIQPGPTKMYLIAQCHWYNSGPRLNSLTQLTDYHGLFTAGSCF